MLAEREAGASGPRQALQPCQHMIDGGAGEHEWSDTKAEGKLGHKHKPTLPEYGQDTLCGNAKAASPLSLSSPHSAAQLKGVCRPQLSLGMKIIVHVKRG